MVFALQMYSNIFKRVQSFLKAFASCYSIYNNCINLSNFGFQATRLFQQNVSYKEGIRLNDSFPGENKYAKNFHRRARVYNRFVMLLCVFVFFDVSH